MVFKKNRFIVCVLIISVFIPFMNVCTEKIVIDLEHAITPQQLRKGLMGRQSMPDNHGMTFTYPSQKFWMLNTLMDLSIAFLDENKIIREIYELKAYPLIKDPHFFYKHAVSATFKASFALEMNTHWFDRHSIKVGDRVEWNPLSSIGYIIIQDGSSKP
jgi:uncharacterized protein